MRHELPPPPLLHIVNPFGQDLGAPCSDSLPNFLPGKPLSHWSGSLGGLNSRVSPLSSPIVELPPSE